MLELGPACKDTHPPICTIFSFPSRHTQLTYRGKHGIICDPAQTPEAFSLHLLSIYNQEIVLEICDLDPTRMWTHQR
jgi:hypothetical protein